MPRGETTGVRLEGSERAGVWNLWSVRGVRFPHLTRLDRRYDGPVSEIWGMEADRLERLLGESGLGNSAAETVLERRESTRGFEERYRAELEQLPDGARLVHLRDPDYPARLHDLEEPPVFLYVHGDLEVCRREASVAMVGSRDAPIQDVRRARSAAGILAEAGLSVVSGGALGIDRASHEGALEVGGETAVLLPAGLDRPSPSSNRDLFERAADHGVVLSEYPLGVEVRRYHFPRRNRLIAALGDATFVVRAGPDSGTMLTANAAREIGRPICALAGDLDEPLAEGCLDLIVEGAQAVRGARDVLEHEFPDVSDDTRNSTAEGTESGTPAGRERALESVADQVSGDASAVLRTAVSAEVDLSRPVHADQLRELLDWPAARVQTALLELELHGVCEKSGGAQAYRFGGVG